MKPDTAAKIADKYITPDGKTPTPAAEPDDEFGGSGRAPGVVPRSAPPSVVDEIAKLEAKAKAQRETAERLRRARIAKLMKQAKNQNGGWQTHPDVLDAVEAWAEQMKTQRWIAAKLGKPVRTFEEALNKEKGENALRLAYERGRAEAEQRHIDNCESLDPKDSKQVVAWIFYMKAQYGWKDKPENSESDGPKITFVLPGPQSEEDYYKSLGISEPIDTRPVQDRTRQLGGVAVGDMKDVTPGADGLLPVMGAQKVLAGVDK